MVCTREIEYAPFGKCIEMENGAARLVVTLDFGPRIISFSAHGGKNVFAEMPDSDIASNHADAFRVFGDRGIWHIRGGHRLWTSPEAMPRSFFPDNAPVSYKVEGNTLTLVGEEQCWVGLAPKMEITMDEKDAKVTVVHTVQNIGAWPITFAPWAISVMASGGTLYLPQNTKDCGRLHNRTLTFWSYTDVTDARFSLGKSTIRLAQSKEAATSFKLGISCERGCGAYVNDGTMFVKTYVHDQNAAYPDGGVSLEAYTDADMLEFETLAPLSEVAPGEAATHAETWYLCENVAQPKTEEEIEKMLSPYCKA